MNTFDLTKVAEITIQYSTKVKAADRPKIVSSSDARDILLNSWGHSIEHVETMKLVLLNRANGVLGISTLSIGGISGCILDIKVVFQLAIKANASGIILAHNHPSGNTNPSEADKAITRKVKEAGILLDLKLIDHIILTPYDGYLSFADEGLL